MKRKILVFSVLLAAVFNVYAARSFIVNSSPTYDEPLHIAGGYSYWKTGKYRINIKDHPPLAEMAGALPLLFFGLDAFETSRPYIDRGQYNWADLFTYQNASPAEKIVNAARLFSYFLWTPLLAFFIFWFAKELVSAEAGLLSVLLFLLTPVFISNNALVATDSAAAAFYLAAFLFALLFARRYKGELKEKKAWLYLGLCALASASAMASKFSMAVLPGFILLMWLIESAAANRAAGLKKLILPALIYITGVFAALAVIYGFTQFNLYFEGLAATAARLEAGRPSFINGHYSMYGVWWYFPFAFLVKTPLSVLIFFAAGVFYSLKNGRKSHIWLFAPFILYFIFAVNSKLQIGVRHILPVMPFCVIFAGAGAAAFLERKYLKPAAVFLIAALAFSVARVHPYYLAYFNEAAGGPGNGYTRLVDSNLDWGQDLKTLAGYLKKEGSPPVYLAYFGTARPEHYGIKYIPFGLYSDVGFKGGLETPCPGGRVLLAVSVTNLQGVYYRNKEFFSWLLEREPVFRAGYSIFVYDLTQDMDARTKMAGTFNRLNLPAYADSLLKSPVPQ
ncbi:MAG: phospholipid carrier-dependent glycosyltransferase [Elusimicrobia bacterium]|nr:phospholipid carrier-dependent glycosyltransferase [Elusimicrobiota bacterium]